MRTVFKNKTFYYLFVSYILLLIFYNLYTGIRSGNSSVMLPITIQSVLLLLVLSHRKYARIAIIVWTAFFQIGGFALMVLGALLNMTVKGFQGFSFYTFIFKVIEIIIGIVILSYVKRTVIIDRTNIKAIDSEITE
jgi:hypothetical protein